ncbi:hypothetical protein ONV78_26835 [Hahella sp. CR1]|uniref:hypothetical protein n=1 Tax=Hahella sp. CR1 TaxID=2992807 RepID=UPI0024413675|nr:hypothetical protein [Hahella sp. CR1]MDG9671379.1 hypothetical protein [Hahella sp. CR1]
MKVEIGGDIQSLEVVEYVIRDIVCSSNPHVGPQSIPHFQARIRIDEKSNYSSFDCELSYSDAENKFLGLTETHSVKRRSVTNEPRSISEALDIPEGTTRVVARFIEEKELSSKWGEMTFKLGGFFILIVLGAWAASSLLSLIG